MKIYLCRKCNQTVPLDKLAEHRNQCGSDAEITLKRSTGAKVANFFKIILLALLSVVLVAGGIFLGKYSFKSVARMRQLERVPATVVEAALPGEINLSGRVERLDKSLNAPKSGKPCFYYRYLQERREVDSDGDSRWVTEKDIFQSVDFVLADETGKIVVRPGDTVDFNMEKSYKNKIGNRRYTEWRIDPEDSVFVFGYVVSAGDGYEVQFNRSGYYDPIISKYGETRERLRMAGFSVFMCWGGLLALAFGVALVIGLLGIHRLLVFFTIMGVVIAVDLSVLGLKMMKSDLYNAIKQLEVHEKTAVNVISDELAGCGIMWSGDWAKLESFETYMDSGLSGEQVARLSRIRLDLAVATERVRMQRNAFPEVILAPIWNVPSPPQLELPEHQQESFVVMLSEFEKARIPKGIGLGVIGVGLFIAVLSSIFGFRKVRFKRCMENLPTSSTVGAAYGLSEFKGIVAVPDDDEPLQGPLSFKPCVAYHYKVEEKRGHGKRSRWVTVINERKRRPFYCRDNDGEILIDPEGAEVMTTLRESSREGRYRYHETRLELNDPLYAIGECVIEPVQGDVLYMRKPEGDYPFVLSNYTEGTVMRKIAGFGVFLLTLSFGAIVLIALTAFGLSGSFAATDYLASALAAPLFITFVTLVLHFNDLVFLRERVDRNLANIDVSLKKRHDLIPNLQKVVKSYMAHESEVLESITQMRSMYDSGVTSNNDARGSYIEKEYRVLSRMLAVYENYPDLKADRNAAYLMKALVLLENEISFMRSGYNDAVEFYNTRIQSIPDVIFARLFSFSDRRFISAESSVIRIPPSVQNIIEKDRVASKRDGIEPAGESEEVKAAEAVLKGNESEALAATAARAVSADGRQPEDVSSDAIDGRAVIYALLLNSDTQTRARQLEAIGVEDSEEARKKTECLIDAVGKQIKNDLGRLHEAEKWYKNLHAVSPSGYRAFKRIVRKLMEEDAKISLFEYALQKSVTRELDPVFGVSEDRPLRYKDLSQITDEAALIMSRLAYAEEEPSQTAEDAFSKGVSLLNHKPETDFSMASPEKCTLAEFDLALEEIAHASNMVKANFYYACAEAVKLNMDFTYNQALLLIALADVLEQKRPDWLFDNEQEGDG